jgi:hypothetical protein
MLGKELRGEISKHGVSPAGMLKDDGKTEKQRRTSIRQIARSP